MMDSFEKPGSAEPQLGTNLNNTTIPEWHSRGYIPHRDKLRLLQFITFRLADSLPQNMLRLLEAELKTFSQEIIEMERRKRIEKWLDSGIGSCALKHPEMAAVTQETFIKFDAEKYRLLEWCIMPNHVHVLIEPYIALGKIVQSWKSYTGRFAMAHNAELGLGVPGESFWMREYWDRYIRNADHLHSVVEYIHNNPVKAGLVDVAENWMWSSAYNPGSAPGSAEPQLSTD